MFTSRPFFSVSTDTGLAQKCTNYNHIFGAYFGVPAEGLGVVGGGGGRRRGSRGGGAGGSLTPAHHSQITNLIILS